MSPVDAQLRQQVGLCCLVFANGLGSKVDREAENLAANC